MKTITDEMIAALRAPLAAKAITQHPTKTYLSSIKPPYVIERLNEVFGLNGWRDEYEVVSAEKEERVTKKGTPQEKRYFVMVVVAKGTLHMDEYGITRTAYGGNEQDDFGDAYKGACTDCLTKMAMQVYIGMDVYKGLGTKSDVPKPAARSEYQTIEGILEDKKADEHGYWFKIGDRAVFKDEQSPADVSPIWDSPTGLKFRLRVIERKSGEKTFYEFVEVIGGPKQPEDLTALLKESIAQVEAKKKSAERTLDTSHNQEMPRATRRTIHVTKIKEPKKFGAPYFVEGFDKDSNEWEFSTFHKNTAKELLQDSIGKECELVTSTSVKGDKTYFNIENWIRIGDRKNPLAAEFGFDSLEVSAKDIQDVVQESR